MVKKLVLLAFLAAPFLAAGCSNSDDDTSPGGGTITPPAGCNADSTLSCSGGSTGFACDIGSNPESEDSSLSCSTPALASGEDDYCCFTGFTGSATTCQPDDSLTAACPDADSYGYTCAAGDNPVTYDATLNCSDPTPDGSNDDFCCTYGSSSSGGGGDDDGAPTGCTVDTTLDCAGNSVGYACTIGDNPEAEDSSLSCSTPALASGEDDYCCFTGFTGSSTTCAPDDSLTDACPDADSYGYVCAAADDDPTTYDSSLNCSDGVADPDGTSTDFCCTYD